MSEDAKVGYEPRYREISLPIFLHSLNKYKGDDEALLKKLNEFMKVNTNSSINDFKSWLKEQIKEKLEPMLIDALENCNADTLFTYDDVVQYIKPVVPHFLKSLLEEK